MDSQIIYTTREMRNHSCLKCVQRVLIAVSIVDAVIEVKDKAHFLVCFDTQFVKWHHCCCWVYILAAAAAFDFIRSSFTFGTKNQYQCDFVCLCACDWFKWYKRLSLLWDFNHIYIEILLVPLRVSLACGILGSSME
jgi:hypothetical protein